MAEKLPEGLEEQVESTIIDPIARLRESFPSLQKWTPPNWQRRWYPGALARIIPSSPRLRRPVSPVMASLEVCHYQWVTFERWLWTGYYADPESDCQSFHICAEDGQGGLNKYLTLHHNGILILIGGLLDLRDCILLEQDISAFTKVQLPLSKRDPFSTAILYLRLVVQRRLLTGKPFHTISNSFHLIIESW